MSYFCEVCNGMSALEVPCPKCLQKAEDCGRYNDYLGPYSPYRGIEDLSLTNGFYDLEQHTCVHLLNCEHCGQQFPYEVQENRI